MTLEYFLMNFGYAAILIGTFLEGESILILGGFAAHRGYLSLPYVMLFAFFGSFIGDQIYFFIGRKKGLQYIEKRPKLAPRFEKFKRLLDRHNIIIILSFRFLYGLRTVAPFAIGLSGISSLSFMALNAVSAAVWAVCIAYAGYYFGHAVEIVLDDIKQYELEIIILIVMVSVCRLIYSYYKDRRAKRINNSDI